MSLKYTRSYNEFLFPVFIELFGVYVLEVYKNILIQLVYIIIDCCQYKCFCYYNEAVLFAADFIFEN